jgi:hypothetical protein
MTPAVDPFIDKLADSLLPDIQGMTEDEIREFCVKSSRTMVEAAKSKPKQLKALIKRFNVISADLPKPHAKQQEFINSTAKRNVIRAGRRGGKTVGVAIRAVNKFLEGKRVLYAAPTQEQIDRFWVEVTRALQVPIDSGKIHRNQTKHLLEIPGTENRIRAKTAWNADSLRGDYADELILDEWQLMNEDAWRLVGAPMLLDNNGNATFVYTPPSLHSRSASKADDPQHAAKLFKRAKADESGRWAVFHFSSQDNPYISAEAIAELTQDMTALAYRMEIEAEDVDEAPGAMWTRAIIEAGRVSDVPEFDKVVVGVDPSATTGGDEAGVITVARGFGHGYVLEDTSVQGSPTTWATAAVVAYHKYRANMIVAEANNGGEMVRLTIATVDPHVPVRLVHASRGKQTRAEPIASLYEKARAHHVGHFEALEDEMCLWLPGDDSPNRMDALVWGLTELNLFRYLPKSLTQGERHEAKLRPEIQMPAILKETNPLIQQAKIQSRELQLKRFDAEAKKMQHKPIAAPRVRFTR